MAVLRAENVGKRYGGTIALDQVDFAVEPGTVSVLIGENGAGKSTLMRILAGIEQPDSGALFLDDAPVRFAGVRDAAAKGIGIVHQELNLCANLSVAENIFLARTPGHKGPLLDTAAEHRATAALMARLEQAITPDAPVHELRIGQQQIVEIAKALAEDCRVLIMDEPTSALSVAEVEVLFRVIRELKRSGVGIVYISHRLEELLRVGDTITVMRNGRIVGSTDVASASVSWIIERMLGEAGRVARAPRSHKPGPAVLKLDRASFDRGAGDPVRDLSACFHADTITAVYGLLGSGRTELFEALCGARDLQSGSIELHGRPIEDLSIADRVKLGILLVPEDRQREGLFPNLSVARNLEMSDLERQASGPLIDAGRVKTAVSKMIGRLGIKTGSPDASIASLSGGNQQKVVIGRTLMPGPSVLLLDEPSRGIDVGARAEVFSTVQQLAGDGLCVVFSTSDVLEALAAADRILVMAGGRITLDAAVADIDEATIMAAANLAAQPATVN
jgi:erythritol transport system ATP-binding protein